MDQLSSPVIDINRDNHERFEKNLEKTRTIQRFMFNFQS